MVVHKRLYVVHKRWLLRFTVLSTYTSDLGSLHIRPRHSQRTALRMAWSPWRLASAANLFSLLHVARPHVGILHPHHAPVCNFFANHKSTVTRKKSQSWMKLVIIYSLGHLSQKSSTLPQCTNQDPIHSSRHPPNTRSQPPVPAR